jgi:hypothetical protein
MTAKAESFDTVVRIVPRITSEDFAHFARWTTNGIVTLHQTTNAETECVTCDNTAVADERFVKV